MRILSLLIVPFVLLLLNQKTDSPHGTDFKVNCSACHSAKGWQLDKEIYSFNHTATKFPLTGHHADVNCRQCHQTLIFKEAKNKCSECHNDVHQTTAGPDCFRCHNTTSWLVNNIKEIHQTSHFPLLGAHSTADCIQCHKSESQTRFDVQGVNCIDCHRQNFMATTNPNHVSAGFSEDCSTCHPSNSFQWSGAGFNHNFFALVQGHSSLKCSDCHTTGRYSDAKADCFSCHQKDYNSTTSPNHMASSFPTTCSNCHTLNPGWKPASFDHSKFPLSLGHSTPKCVDCHTNGNYSSISSDCFSCHQQDYLATTNPNHNSSGFSKACLDCHTTNPGWKPTTFKHSSFPLTLGHSGPSCNDCHKGNYSSITTDCYSCHQTDFNKTVNPSHQSLGFSFTCTQCHTTNPGWKPASYAQHDSQSFPIYSGSHKGKWNTCNDCHSNPSSYAQFNCINCHEHNKADMDSKHQGRTGYSYDSASCFHCHPRGKAD